MTRRVQGTRAPRYDRVTRDARASRMLSPERGVEEGARRRPLLKKGEESEERPRRARRRLRRVATARRDAVITVRGSFWSLRDVQYHVNAVVTFHHSHGQLCRLSSEGQWGGRRDRIAPRPRIRHRWKRKMGPWQGPRDRQVHESNNSHGQELPFLAFIDWKGGFREDLGRRGKWVELKSLAGGRGSTLTATGNCDLAASEQ